MGPRRKEKKMKWLLLTLLVLTLVVLLIVAVGAMLPVQHTASRSAVFATTPETVWRLITDVERFPSWRSGVKSVERLPERGGKAVWVEDTTSGRITLGVDRMEPPRLLVLRIADPDLPFGGTWTYEVAPTSDGTRLTITENGEIYNIFFRFMARFIFGYEGTIATYLESLQKRIASAESHHGI